MRLPGYYQPAGPLISSHLVPQSQPVSTKAGSSGLDGDTVQSSSTPGSDSTDREILITGGTPRPQTFHYPPQGHGPYQRPIHQMHCPTYPPANYYASYGQHPQDMCYSPPYQTYYPQKVYPSSYRRYVTPSGTYYQPAPNEMYEAPPASAQPQQPPSSQQIVPTGPQHIEHYPPFYSGYSPGGGPGGCYNRSMQPPYIDSSPYPNSCPCPMQSCPKNVHTGPLIGSKTGKGPVQSNHLVAPIDTATSVTLSSNSTSVNQKINCKTEDVSSPPPVVMVKPEGDTHLHLHTMPVSDVTKSPVRDKVYEKIGHAPPNFALNIKALEPEMSLSPARGSTGLLPSVQASATQPADNAPTVRKTRVGKTMAREMVMIPQQRQVLNLHVDKKSNPRLVAEHTDIIMEVKDATPLIKKENVRIEYEDDDVFILDSRKCETPTKVINDHMSCLNCDESMSSADDVNICNKRRSTESDVITLDDSIEESPPSSTVKKRKILELHKNPCKKSPPNSYKSLIKQSDPRSYLFKADVAEKDVPRGRSRYRLIRGRASPRYRQSEIIINGKHKKVLITNRKVKRRIIKKHVTKKLIPKTKVVQTDVMEVQVNEVVKLKSKDVAQESTEEKTEEKRLFMSSLELTVDGVAKGYVSDQEILAKSKLNSKTKCTESHSKSETQKPLIVESIESNVKMRDRSKSATKTAAESKSEPKTAKGKAKDDKASKNAKKATLSLVSDEMLMDDHSINNNNTILLDNNYGKLQRAISTKKTKSRGAKFSNKKRHRVRQLQEIEDIEIPRKSTAAPRWSNGWHWEGNPFKGKVFLNSDDVQVIRTRYPAMRHDSGDIIEPGDCVLLRAGGKKNELPYVAKVASLWENPEDGEMMMSLLWYYRPEHTEQGRQIHDCPDEVFASKHQDHNSVACIEDKCYVLTFNEYCRNEN
ncbi:Bromo adjacent likey domain-containing 1 protein [Pseudolycoriella hygida]|uniref:Bromo adjacent likey domain-containing 1 protein n=1 Tax=Pseudolycoriella hygida TaxID=35572 RepID=A0A9Q0MMV4_9DIPT|nr:Bromo adjacent likey domain-containing 1 protein [Pseudolycoriella hygida]